ERPSPIFVERARCAKVGSTLVGVPERAEQQLPVAHALGSEFLRKLEGRNLRSGSRVVLQSERVPRRADRSPPLADDRLLPLVQFAADHEERVNLLLAAARRERFRDNGAEGWARQALEGFAVEPGSARGAAGKTDGARDAVIVRLRVQRADDREL